MNTIPSLRSTLVRTALVTAALLAVPLVAMQFTAEVNWGPGDFVVAGVLLFGAGMLYALGARLASGKAQRVALALSVAAGLALVWAELAVGIFD